MARKQVTPKAPAITGDELIVSTDAGNGKAGVYYVDAKGKLRSSVIPHLRARVTGAKMNSDLLSQNTIDYADWGQYRYGYGDGLWHLTDSAIDTHQNSAARYADDMHLFLIFVNIALLNIPTTAPLTLIIPAPPGLINQVSGKIKERVLAGQDNEGDGIWRIQLSTDRKPREYRVNRVIVIPEGAGAFSAYQFDDDGNMVEGAADVLLAGVTRVMDAGAGTFDVFTVFDGVVNADRLMHATDDRGGVIEHLQMPVLNYIRQLVPNASFITLAEIDSLLRRYLQEPSEATARLNVGGKWVNTEEVILDSASRYATWQRANKIDPALREGTACIAIAGGGFSFTLSYILPHYERANCVILTPNSFNHTRKIALWDLNGVGQLRFVKAYLKRMQIR